MRRTPARFSTAEPFSLTGSNSQRSTAVMADATKVSPGSESRTSTSRTLPSSDTVKMMSTHPLIPRRSAPRGYLGATYLTRVSDETGTGRAAASAAACASAAARSAAAASAAASSLAARVAAERASLKTWRVAASSELFGSMSAARFNKLSAALRRPASISSRAFNTSVAATAFNPCRAAALFGSVLSTRS